MNLTGARLIAAAGALLAALAGGQASASETRSFVAKWVYTANYSQDSNCPQGLNSGADENFRRILRERGTPPDQIEKTLADFPYSMYLAGIATRGKIDGKPANVYLYPTSTPDPMLKLGQGHVGLGFNLDGRVGKSDFTDPETGEQGVDNQLFRVVDCTVSLRSAPGHHPPLPEIQWDLTREHNQAWLVEISGIDDEQNDDDVVVRIFQAKGSVRRDANGNPLVDMTFTPDPNPRTAGNVVHGRIKNGVLSTDVFDFFMPGDPFVQTDYAFKQARLRFTFGADRTARGILGGYQNWRTLYISWALAGIVYEVNNSLDIPGLYYALRKSADAYPDPKTGENTFISSAYMIDLIPAFIESDPTKSPVRDKPMRTRAAIGLLPIFVAFAAHGEAVRLFGFESSAPLATPPGITLRSVQIGQGVNVPGQSSVTPRLRLIFADAADQPLYTFDKDEAGKSNCGGECAALWRPALVSARGDKPPSGWSIVQRGDSGKQWAFLGRPLYTYLKEGAAGDMGGMGGPTAKGHDVDGVWHVMEVKPDQWMPLPSGILIDEVPTAPGLVLVNEKKQPLYMLSGKAGQRRPRADWTPVTAPQLAVPFDDFTVVAGADGIYQWAWHGKPLFTYAGDVEFGDSNGKNADPRFEVALVMRYFMPAEVAILPDQRRGGILATVGGQVLYARDRAYAHLQGGFNTRGANHGALATGRSIGLTGCDGDCEQTRRPLKAPAEAEASGYWSVITRPDGAKQWAYQGYALYTYAREKPGEVTGNAIFDLTVNDGGPSAQGAASLGLYWRVCSP